MGIHKLMSLLNEKSPGCVRKMDLSAFAGRIVACDASMAMYQFLITTQGFTNENQGFQISELTDKQRVYLREGNKTGHLVGLFNRTLMLLENGIKPIWVFDGKPPELKREELRRRKQIKFEAKEDAQNALETGNIEEAQKMQQRTTTITQKMVEDAKQMIRLMGLPVIEAPSEAEAQCAQITKDNKDVYASATEDMDTLTFGTQNLLRGFNSKKEPITEINFDEMLKEMDYDQFIDLCILCGCDYADSIDGIGPVTAFKLIKNHRNLENVLEFLREENKIKQKYRIPSKYPFEEIRNIFKNPEVTKDVKFKFQKPDEQGMIKFLVEEKSFSEQRVLNAIKKIKVIILSRAKVEFKKVLRAFSESPPQSRLLLKNQIRSLYKKDQKNDLYLFQLCFII